MQRLLGQGDLGQVDLGQGVTTGTSATLNTYVCMCTASAVVDEM